jgi:uncharacterized protein YecE (DUF72 family)
MILIGTSGFSYDDWKGFFYPEDLDKRDMLAYYASQFPAVEVNSTYYTIPGPGAFYGMARKTPPDFKFTVKVHKDMTHAEETDRGVFRTFAKSIHPLVEQGKLGCVLAQYPWGFKPSEAAHGRLRELRDELADAPTVVEFRNAAWVTPQTFELLRELHLGFCCVDEPNLRGLVPAVAAATSPVGYVRFHGRNAARWWNHEHAWERYDYLYTEEELSQWVPKVQSLAAKTDVTYLFFNNHYQGKSAQNAKMFAKMLSLPYPEAGPAQSALFDAG